MRSPNPCSPTYLIPLSYMTVRPNLTLDCACNEKISRSSSIVICDNNSIHSFGTFPIMLLYLLRVPCSPVPSSDRFLHCNSVAKRFRGRDCPAVLPHAFCSATLLWVVSGSSVGRVSGQRLFTPAEYCPNRSSTERLAS